ncbi:hypothetical protein F4861DRAFT_14740 [Xylaria intraflava]|nr:hypothetical protein F4861DRAFT_14740 [Xylaria intraflava]
MNKFGVIELASAKTTTAPGWAYVPDRPQQHAVPATNRKRARNAATTGGAALSLADASARQEAKARREIEILDRDNARDVQIAIPAKRSGSTKSAAVKKYTPNVRKVLQSQKTFANHLDDYVALVSQQEANPGANSTAAATETTRNPSRQPPQQTAASSKTPTAKQEPEDTEMLDIDPAPTTKTQSQQQQPYPQDSNNNDADNNPLLATRLPPLPSEDTLRALVSAPPLSYLEARGTWPPSDSGQQYPARAFCVVCGYWGRVRCMKCGTRVCALECLEIHREDCITRYGL